MNSFGLSLSMSLIVFYTDTSIRYNVTYGLIDQNQWQRYYLRQYIGLILIEYVWKIPPNTD